MTALLIAIGLTLGISGFCSLLEAMILSTSTAEIEALKQRNPSRGKRLERLKENMEETSSAILSLNTVANTLGASFVGGLALMQYGEDRLVYFSLALTGGILFFSEIIPKNVGFLYRKDLQPSLTNALYLVTLLMWPLSKLCKLAVKSMLPKAEEEENESDTEIRLLAEKGAREGELSKDERDMISNALSLDDVKVNAVMTPRTVVMALEQTTSVAAVCAKYPNIPFARIPVYDENIDNILGVVRRRDILNSDAEGQPVGELMYNTIFIPEMASCADALQLFLKNHQQLALVVDEFGSTAGVITMEDVFEQIIGKEIFEQDDIAIDMRELAKRKKEEESEA